jgi:SAM-dependent methyltransferase
MNDDLIYTETTVRFYDIIHEEYNPASKDFYINEILKAKGSVLEIGTGTGRIFSRGLAAGADTYGIDISEVMQSYLKEKINSKEHFRLKIADVRNFEFCKKFKLIIAPFRIFSHLISVDDQLMALKCIREHLEEDGKFILDVFVPSLERIKTGNEITLRIEHEYERGKKLQWFDAAKPDYINQIQHVTFKFVWEQNDGIHEESAEFPMRYYFRYELEHLIARSGLKLDKMYGDFQYNELVPSSDDMVCVCTKN